MDMGAQNGRRVWVVLPTYNEAENVGRMLAALVAALSGLLMTLLYVALSVVPIIRVESRLLFALKISGLVVVANAAGLGVYLAALRRRGREGREQSVERPA